MVGGCHSQLEPNALSALWIRLGAVIRMVCGREDLLRPKQCSFTLSCRLKIWALLCRSSKAEYQNVAQAIGSASHQQPIVFLNFTCDAMFMVLIAGEAYHMGIHT
jgi:hypothetical protein